MPMICSSLNLERFIVRPLLVTDPTDAWRRFWGSGQFFPSRTRLASRRPPMRRRRNLQNSAVPTPLVRGSRLAFRATMCRAEDDLEARWNRFLTIFDPYTFLHRCYGGC